MRPSKSDAITGLDRGFAASCHSLVGMIRWLFVVVGLPALCGPLGACTLLKLQGDLKAYKSSSVLVGRVSVPNGWTGRVVVAAYSNESGHLVLAHSVLLHEPGAFELVVPEGAHRIFAFGDTNGNSTFDAGEPCGEYRGSPSGTESGTGLAVYEISIGFAPAQCSLPPGTQFTSGAGSLSHSTQAGAIARLDDSFYSSAEGRRGYWEPTNFLREVGSNIYFAESYDPAKIPILFVHGAAGSPQDWRYFLSHIDRSKFQPWIFYYPSGASIDVTSELLFWKLLNLQQKFHYQALCVTAHSMGGLVVRNLLVRHGAQLPAVKMFVSLSTPWGGHDFATTGVKFAPAVVPSWKDLDPAGPFMTGLFAHPLPPGVDHYFFFSHRGTERFRRRASDGTVTLASQLLPAAQFEAKSVWGFDEDHESILSSPQVIARYNATLARFHADVQSRSERVTGAERSP